MITNASAVEHLRTWNPIDPDQLANPYPTYALARREAPVFYSEYFDAWCVTRYHDVVDAVRNTTGLSSRQAIGSGYVPQALQAAMPQGYPWDHPALVNNDPPQHTRIRRLANEAFRPKVIAERADEIAEIIDDLMDRFTSDGRVEFISQFADRLPQLVICRLLGVPDEYAEALARWSEDKILMVNPVIEEDHLVELARGQADFYTFCDDFVTEQRARGRDDSLMSRLIHAHEDDNSNAPPLSQKELIAIIAQLLLGGNSTTRRMLSIMVLRLIEHPDQLAALAEDHSLAANAVEECLRFNTSVKGLYRDAVQDVEIGNTMVPTGSRVVIFWASANHDETVFDRSEEFDIFRSDAVQHLAFSRGSHFCLGARLAKLELTITLNRILERLPGLALDGSQPFYWEPLALHAGLSCLKLRFNPV